MADERLTAFLLKHLAKKPKWLEGRRRKRYKPHCADLKQKFQV